MNKVALWRQMAVMLAPLALCACPQQAEDPQAREDAQRNVGVDRVLLSDPVIAMNGSGDAVVLYTETHVATAENPDGTLREDTGRVEVLSQRYFAMTGWEPATQSVSERPNSLDPSHHGRLALVGREPRPVYPGVTSELGIGIWVRGSRVGVSEQAGVYAKAYRTPSGWGDEAQFVLPTDDVFPVGAVAINSLGVGVAVFAANSGLSAVRYTPADGWGPRVTIAGVSDFGLRPFPAEVQEGTLKVTIDKDENTFVVWRDNSDDGIYTVRWQGEPVRSEPLRLNPPSDAFHVGSPVLAQNNSTRGLHRVFWKQRLIGQDVTSLLDRTFVLPSFDGAPVGWMGQQPVIDTFSSRLSFTTEKNFAAVGVDGNEFLVVWDNFDSIRSRRSCGGTVAEAVGCWREPVVATPLRSGVQGHRMDMAVNPDGAFDNNFAVLVWQDADDHKLYGSLYDDRSASARPRCDDNFGGQCWTEPQVLTPEAVQLTSPKVAMDDTGSAVAVWIEGGSEGQHLGRYVFGAAIPRFDYGPIPVAVGATVNFDASSSVLPTYYSRQASGSPWIYEWEFDAGPGSPVRYDYTANDDARATHVFPAAGNYRVRLTIRRTYQLEDLPQPTVKSASFERMVQVIAPTGGPAAPEALDLTVEVNDVDDSRVRSDPLGIDCPTTCQHRFATTGTVVLTAEAAQFRRFASWGPGECDQVFGNQCILWRKGSVTVHATFLPD